MHSRHRNIATGRSATALGHGVSLALAFAVLMVCTSDAQQQRVNVPAAGEAVSRTQAAADSATDSAAPKATDTEPARMPESAPEPAPAPPAPAAPPLADFAIGRMPYAALVIGSSLDLGTSLHAFVHTPGVKESNPLLAHGGTHGFVAGKVAATVGLVWAMHRIAKGGHPTLAKVIGWTGGIALSGVAYSNARTQER